MRIALATSSPRLAAITRIGIVARGHELVLVDRKDGAGIPSDADLALVDLADGDEILHKFVSAGVWVVAVGASNDQSEVLRAIRAGARDYVPPDASSEDLAATIERCATAPTPSPTTEVRATLRYADEEGKPCVHHLTEGDALTIGRDPANNIVFDQQVVSRFHARFDVQDGALRIADRESRHGVLVDDEKLTSPRALQSGSIVRLGKPGAPEIAVAVRRSRRGAADLRSTLDESGDDAGRELKNVASLLDTFLQLNSELVLDDVLSLVIDRSIEFTGAERGMILLREDDGELAPATARDSDGSEVDPAGLAISQKIPREVLESGVGVIVADLLADDRVDAHVNTIEFGVRSAMCVPLRARRPAGEDVPSLLGVLYVDSSIQSRPFSDDLLHALESLAAEAAQAIVNARLYRVSLEKRKIDEEMQLAREIQESLLPPRSFSNDWVELCGSSRSSLEVGGDVLDYYPGDSHLGILVGDVSGKGVPAAIYSAMLDGHFHALAGRVAPDADLGDIASQLNQHLVSRSRLEKFVTLVFAILDRNGELIFINAGHLPPLLVTNDGDVRKLPPGGTVLGMLDDVTYESNRDTLAPGDTLVLYSDGVTEARNPEREFYGIDRLTELVRQKRDDTAEEIHDAVHRDWEVFTGGAPPTDDVTLMVIKKIR